jgi:hypothetical protein
MKRFARNKPELAKLVGLHRSSLERFFSMFDHPKSRADGRWPVKDWRSFVRAHRSRLGNNGSNGLKYESNAREAAMIQKAEADAARTRFKLATEQGQFLPRQTVCHQVEEANALIRRELFKSLTRELPPKLACCMNATEMRKPLRQLAADLCEQLSSQLMSLAAANNGASTVAG